MEVEFYIEHPLNVYHADLRDLMKVPFMTEEIASGILKLVKKGKNIKQVYDFIDRSTPYSDYIKMMISFERSSRYVDATLLYDGTLKYGGYAEYVSPQVLGNISFLRKDSININCLSMGVDCRCGVDLILGSFRIFSPSGFAFLGKPDLPGSMGPYNKRAGGSFYHRGYGSWRVLRGISLYRKQGVFDLGAWFGYNSRYCEVEGDSIVSIHYDETGERVDEYDYGGLLGLSSPYISFGVLMNSVRYGYPFKGGDFDMRGWGVVNYVLYLILSYENISLSLEGVRGRGVGLDGKFELEYGGLLNGFEFTYLGDTLFTPYGRYYGLSDRRERKLYSYYIHYRLGPFSMGTNLKFEDSVAVISDLRLRSGGSNIYIHVYEDGFNVVLKQRLFHTLYLKLYERYYDESWVFGSSVLGEYLFNFDFGGYLHGGDRSLSVYIPFSSPWSSSLSLDDGEWIIFASIKCSFLRVVYVYPENILNLGLSFRF